MQDMSTLRQWAPQRANLRSIEVYYVCRFNIHTLIMPCMCAVDNIWNAISL